MTACRETVQVVLEVVRLDAEFSVKFLNCVFSLTRSLHCTSASDSQETETLGVELRMSAVEYFLFQFRCYQISVSAHFALANKLAGFERGIARFGLS